MRHLSLAEILELHARIIASSGGTLGVRDLGALESSAAQPWVTFDGRDLYPDTVSKAAALCFSLVMNHPFLDGNKRVGHAAMEVFLLLNGHELDAEVDDQERVILTLAAGDLSRDAFLEWLRDHVKAG